MLKRDPYYVTCLRLSGINPCHLTWKKFYFICSRFREKHFFLWQISNFDICLSDTSNKAEIIANSWRITNFTWTDPVSNPDLRCGIPAPSRLTHGTAFKSTNLMLCIHHMQYLLGCRSLWRCVCRFFIHFIFKIIFRLITTYFAKISVIITGLRSSSKLTEKVWR